MCQFGSFVVCLFQQVPLSEIDLSVCPVLVVRVVALLLVQNFPFVSDLFASSGALN